ncbi:hypothetical protein RRG08_018626 [Elysia crispata]|uniref:Uncharacterized protein n=1 Tax=Elysia crispata TaxID=231223 RepID=A0AAE0Z083_9GAST|nr:hypothetical protein RRG08_018626 [Elysia crispata]
MEVKLKVTKDYPSTIFFKFKTSHLDESHNQVKSVTLNRQQADRKFPLMRLNNGPVKIPPAKCNDLISLCTGSTALVRASDHKAFYMS